MRELSNVSARHLLRLDGWQRCLRQLVGVHIRGLDAPMDVHVELQVPPPPASVRLTLMPLGGGVRATVVVHTEAQASNEGDPLLYRSETVLRTANPTWSFEPLPLGPNAGALRSVRVVVYRVNAADDDGGEGATSIVWQQTVVFEKLVHLVTELAFPDLLPPGTLLLQFEDGLCIDPQVAHSRSPPTQHAATSSSLLVPAPHSACLTPPSAPAALTAPTASRIHHSSFIIHHSSFDAFTCTAHAFVSPSCSPGVADAQRLHPCTRFTRFRRCGCSREPIYSPRRHLAPPLLHNTRTPAKRSQLPIRPVARLVARRRRCAGAASPASPTGCSRRWSCVLSLRSRTVT